MHCRVRHRLRLFAAPLACGLAAATIVTGAWAGTDYRLSSGDVLDFAVAGFPDLHQKAPVGVDGTVSLPLLGEVAAAGKTLAELRGLVRGAIAQKELRQHTPGSRGGSDVVWPDQVSLAVAEYRPIYLNGDVAKPGEQTFRPGMTVRQALSLAGGYDILRFRMDNPFLQTAEMRGAYESAWIDYAKEQAHLSTLRKELGADDQGDALADPPVPRQVLAAIRDVEKGYLDTRLADFQNQQRHLDGLLAQQDSDIAALGREHDTQGAGVKDDEDEFNRVQGLYKVGTLPLTRVVEARRVMLLSATQALASQVELERARTEREVTRRKRESLGDERRMELLKAQQDSQTKLAGMQAQIQALAEKLLYAGALKTQLTRGTGGQPDLVLFREGGKAMPATEDTELQPGDVVEVALRVENATALTH